MLLRLLLVSTHKENSDEQQCGIHTACHRVGDTHPQARWSDLMAWTPSAPAPCAFPIVPSDTVPIREPYKRIYVGGAGNIAVKNADSSVTTYTAIPVGSYITASYGWILATGTTATLLVAEK